MLPPDLSAYHNSRVFVTEVNGAFSKLDTAGMLWTNTAVYNDEIYPGQPEKSIQLYASYIFDSEFPDLSHTLSERKSGYSVRCMRDTPMVVFPADTSSDITLGR